MKKVFIALYSILFLIGCTAMTPKPWPPYDVRVINDKFDGYRIDRMTENWVGHYEYLPPRGGVQLNAQRYQAKNGKVLFSLIVDYTGRNWLFIERGETLILLVDGKRMAFSGDGSWGRRKVVYRSVEELAWYDLDYRDLTRIVNASSVELKLIGFRHYITDWLTETNLRNLRRFVDQYKP